MPNLAEVLADLNQIHNGEVLNYESRPYPNELERLVGMHRDAMRPAGEKLLFLETILKAAPHHDGSIYGMRWLALCIASVVVEKAAGRQYGGNLRSFNQSWLRRLANEPISHFTSAEDNVGEFKTPRHLMLLDELTAAVWQFLVHYNAMQRKGGTDGSA